MSLQSIKSRLIPIDASMLVRETDKLSNYTYWRIMQLTTYLPFIVVDLQGKLVGIASKSDIKKYIEFNKNDCKSITFGDVANHNIELYTIDNLPSEQQKYIVLIINDHNKPVYFLRREDTPYITDVVIDVVDACNLKCRICSGSSGPNSSAKMSLQQFDAIIETFSMQYGIRMFTLYNWREPFIAHDLNEYFDILDKHKCKGTLSSNLSIKSIKQLEQIIKHNALEYIYVSVSGFTNDVHQIYHCGSDINIVKDHLFFVSELKLDRLLNSFFFIKYLKFDYNVDEIQQFEEYARELGLGFIVFDAYGDLAFFNEKHQITHQTTQEKENHRLFAEESFNSDACCKFFNQIVIDANCDIFLCCVSPNTADYKLGNFFTDSVDEIYAKKLHFPACQKCNLPRCKPHNVYVKTSIASSRTLANRKGI